MSCENLKLGNICQIDGGYAFKSKNFSEQGLPIIRISNINNSTVNLENVVKIPKTALSTNSKKFLLKPGDVLIAMSGATTGKIGVVPNEFKGQYYLNQRVGRFRILDASKLSQKYLFNFVSSQSFQTQVLNFAAGAAQPNISPKQLVEFKIPLPPLETQKRIVELLDRAQALIDKRKEQIGLMDQLIQSLFYDMFGDPVTNPMGWKFIEFGRNVEQIIGGKSVGGEARDLLDGEYAVLKISAVTSGIFNSKEFKVVDSNDVPEKMIHPEKGDLLFSRANTRELVGATCIVDADYNNLFLPDKLWKIEFNHSHLANRFVQTLLTHEGFRTNLKKVATGTSGSMLNISKAKLLKLSIPTPPIVLQNTFAEQVQQIESQKEAMTVSLQELGNNFNSISQRAFKGEI